MNRTLSTWSSFRELDEWSNHLASAFSRSAHREKENNVFSTHLWAPAADITEDEKEYSITMDLPGVDKKDVNVSVEKGVLSITGERLNTVDTSKATSHRTERSYGTFRRSFLVPEDADGGKVVAEYKNGVLHLHLPKAPKPQPRQIEVKVS